MLKDCPHFLTQIKVAATNHSCWCVSGSRCSRDTILFSMSSLEIPSTLVKKHFKITEISCNTLICVSDVKWKQISNYSLSGCATGLRWARYRSQTDHYQSGVLLQPQRPGQREGQSRPCPKCPDPWRHTAGGADRTRQVTGHTHNQGPLTKYQGPSLRSASHPVWLHHDRKKWFN